jgi:HTH-type transcriptional regulator/antitoxin HigA
VNIYVLFAWQKICEFLTENTVVSNELDIDKLKQKIPKIRKLMFTEPHTMRQVLVELFAECGIAFEIVKNFRGAPVQGFIKAVGNGKTILCMTLRRKSADIFWFTLFHEIGHIINGDARKNFVDFLSVESESETRADNFAKNKLLDSKKYKKFIDKGDFSIETIKAFACEEGVMPFIVIERLKKERHLDWATYSGEMVKYQWWY